MLLKPLDEAPDFRLEALNGRNGGPGHVSLAEQLARGPFFGIFAKPSCPTCQWCLPLLDRLHRNYVQAGATVALVLQESAEEADRFVKQYGLEMPVVVDPVPHRVSEAFGIKFVPTSFWIRQDGRIEQVIESFERESLKQVNLRLAEAAGTTAKTLFSVDEGIPAFRPG